MPAPHRRPIVVPLATVAAVGAGLVACGGPAAHADGQGGTARTGQATISRLDRGGNAGTAGKPGAGATARFRDWPQYHRNAARSGTVADVGRHLHRSWAAKLDGAVYGEPIVAAGRLIAATENDTVYALNPATGHVRWHRHLGPPQPLSGLPCGDIDPLGITGTPAYDHKTGAVFVAAETSGGKHTLWALNASNGRPRWHRSLDTQPNRNRKAEQQRSALLLAKGRVITTFGGLAGDCDNYVGYATSVSTTGKGKVHSYSVPTRREAGMWAPAGAVKGRNGNVYLASGNGAEVGGRYDGSDSVIELTPNTLRKRALFAPGSWSADNRDDLDLGSSSPIPVNGRIVIAGKRGVAYLLKPSLGGVGSALAQASGCQAYGGAAHRGSLAVLPCNSGVRALAVGKHSLHWRWSASGIWGSPVMSKRHVYVADRNSGDLVVLSVSSGKVLSRVSAGPLSHFPSELVDGGQVFVPTLTGVTAFRAG
jgi:hypothetical protein